MTMHTPDDPDLQAKRGLNHEEWFLREVDKGIAAADPVTSWITLPYSS
jgi:hypothetical protein